MTRKRLLLAILPTVVVVTAVAGGTFAVFSDTEYIHPQFEAGNIDIEVSGEAAVFQAELVPDGFDDWKPGDVEDFTFTVTNTGDNKAWLQIYVYETGPWDVGKPHFWDHATWSVEPAVPNGEWNRWVLDPTECKEFLLTVEFPQWVGNDYQNAQGDLLIIIVAKQWRNKYEEGYACVPLENKSGPPDWVPVMDDALSGLICFKPDGAGNLLVDLNAYGLVPNAYYQLDFTGGDQNNPIDGACTAQDAALAGMPGDLFVSGYWNWGVFLEAACNPTNGGEGVWNYAGVYSPGVQADSLGSINFGATLAGMPALTYQGVGAHVKEIKSGGSNVTDDTLLPGDEWNVVLNEIDYLSFTLP